MGWFTDAKIWVQSVLAHETTAAIGNSIYDTAVYSFEQIGTIPKVARSLFFHPSTNKVGKHLLHVIVNDITPMVLVNFANSLVQKNGHDYLDNHQDNQVLSANTTIQAGLYLLNSAAFIYSFRKQTEFIVHMSVVTIETPHIANSIKASTPVICNNTCSPIEGSIRDLAAYVATDIAISCIRYAPGVGGPVASLLGVLHKGRYIASTGALSKLCNDHQIIFLKTYPELAWSLGLSHVSMSALINYLIKNSTGIPSVFYASAIDPIMLIMLMIVAAHMDVPAAPRSSTRRSIDPVALYQYLVGLGVDTVLIGLKNQIPKMLRGRRPGNIADVIRQVPWEYIDRTRVQIQRNPITQILLPKVLHDLESFVNDPITLSNWRVVNESIIHAMKMIESLKTSYAIRISSTAPGVSSSLVEVATGLPKFVTKLILQLLTDRQVHEFIRLCRIKIEMLGREADENLVASYEMIDQRDTTPPEDPPLEQISAVDIRRRLSQHIPSLPAANALNAERASAVTLIVPPAANPNAFFASRLPALTSDADPSEDVDWTLIDSPKTLASNSLLR